MLFLLILALPLTALAIVDTDCTSGGAYTPEAFNCQNKATDAYCNSLYPQSEPAIGPASTAERPEDCYGSGTSIDEEAKSTAVSQCAKSCGYCCLTMPTPAVTCKDAQIPRIPCSSLTKQQCSDPNSISILQVDCPATCGLCAAGNCTDKATTCNPTLCITKGMEDFVAQFCQRTCNMCATPTTGTGGTATPAINCDGQTAHPYCARWVQAGFCTTAGYTQAQKVQYCCAACFGSAPTTGTSPGTGPTAINCAGETAHPNCANWVANGFCGSTGYTQAQKRQFCCAACFGTGTGTATPAVSCAGQTAHPNCASWAANEFCNNAGYTLAQKMQYCCSACFGAGK